MACMSCHKWKTYLYILVSELIGLQHLCHCCILADLSVFVSALQELMSLSLCNSSKRLVLGSLSRALILTSLFTCFRCKRQWPMNWTKFVRSTYASWTLSSLALMHCSLSWLISVAPVSSSLTRTDTWRKLHC